MLAPCYDYISVTLCLYDHLVFDLLYHFMLWSICFVAMHDYGLYALLVGRIQSFASLHLYWVWALLVHPTTKNQSLPSVSTISTYLWYFFATSQVVCLCATFKSSNSLLVLCILQLKVICDFSSYNACCVITMLSWGHHLHIFVEYHVNCYAC